MPTDTTPDAFSFTAVTDAELNTEHTSDAITVSGINVAVSIGVTTGGTLVVDDSDFSGSTVSNGQTVAVKLTSSSQPNTSVTATVTIGGVSADFMVTTRAATPPTMVMLSVSNNETLSPTISWDAVAGADHYRLEWNSTSVITEATSYTFSGLSNGTYNLTVYAVDGNGSDLASGTTSFVVIPTFTEWMVLLLALAMMAYLLFRSR